MNIVVSLAPDSVAKKPEVGDIVKIQVFFDEKMGGPGDGWEISAPSNTAWMPAGGVTVATMSVRNIPTDGNATKLELEAMVHQPGPLIVGPFLLKNQVTKAEVEVPFSTIGGTEVVAGTKPAEEPPWILGPVPFGGWDWYLLALLLAVVVLLGATVGRFALRRLRSHLEKNLTNTERAVHSLANLQKYLRSKKPLDLAEWKKFSFELADILRRYCDENFKMDTRDMTDREFLYELRAHNAAAPYVTLLATILGTITEVRYGKKNLDASVIPGLLLDSKKFVESTSTDVKTEEVKK